MSATFNFSVIINMYYLVHCVCLPHFTPKNIPMNPNETSMNFEIPQGY